MPRAEKPNARLGPYPKPVVLDSAKRKHLCGVLGLHKNDGNAGLVAEHIESCLTDYYVLARNASVTPGNLLATLLPLKTKAEALIAEIKQLDSFSMATLGEAGWNPRFEKTFRAILGSLDRQIAKIESNNTRRKKENWPLTLTVNSLFFAYHHFRGPNAGDWRSFVSEALSYGGIRHPHPEDEPSRFNKLLSEAIRSRLVLSRKGARVRS